MPRGDSGDGSGSAVARHGTMDHPVHRLHPGTEQSRQIRLAEIGQTGRDSWRIRQTGDQRSLSDPGEESVTIHGSVSTSR